MGKMNEKKVTTLTLDPTVVELLKDKGINISETVREMLLLLVSSNESKGKEKLEEEESVLLAEISELEEELNAKLEEIRPIEDEITELESELRPLNVSLEIEKIKLRPLYEKLDDKKRLLREVKVSLTCLKAKEVIKINDTAKNRNEEMETFRKYTLNEFRKFKTTWKMKLEEGFTTERSVYEAFWMQPKGSFSNGMGGMELRFSCGFKTMSEGESWLKNNEGL